MVISEMANKGRTMATELQKDFDLAVEYLEARERDDKKEAERLFPKVRWEPETLMTAKETFGADYIRQRGYNTEKADKEYGPGWLDR